jgi:hypothetical protein
VDWQIGRKEAKSTRQQENRQGRGYGGSAGRCFLAVRVVAAEHWLRNAQQQTPDRSNYAFNDPSDAPNSKQALVPFKNTTDKESDNVYANGR